jgi:hypothetical protein
MVLTDFPLTSGCAKENSEIAEDFKEKVLVSVPSLGLAAFRIPAKDEIREMEVELYPSSARLPEIPSFKIDDKYIDDVYNFFREARIDQEPIVGFPDTASVKLRMETGEIMRIAIHQVVADKPLQFSILGVRLKQDPKSFKVRHGSGAFEGYIRRIYFWQTGHITLKLPSDTLHKIGLDKEPNPVKENN